MIYKICFQIIIKLVVNKSNIMLLFYLLLLLVENLCLIFYWVWKIIYVKWVLMLIKGQYIYQIYMQLFCWGMLILFWSYINIVFILVSDIESGFLVILCIFSLWWMIVFIRVLLLVKIGVLLLQFCVMDWYENKYFFFDKRKYFYQSFEIIVRGVIKKFVDFNLVVIIYLIVINISVFCCNNCFENVDSLILM